MNRMIMMLGVLFFTLSLQAQEPNKKKEGKTIIKTQKKRIDNYNDSIYYDRTSQKELDGMYIPIDLYDCFKVLNKQMSATALTIFKAYSDEEVDQKTHGTLGFWMEHKWSISEGSRLTEYFRKMGVPHYDYMIGIIIQSYHRSLHGKELKVKEQVLKFREIWDKKQGKKIKEMLINKG